VTTARMPRGRRAHASPAPAVLPFPVDPPDPLDSFLLNVGPYRIVVCRYDLADYRRLDEPDDGWLHATPGGSAYTIRPAQPPAVRLAQSGRRRG
jgi:hypothetical protein